MPGYKEHVIGGLAAYALGMTVLHAQCQSPVIATEWLICSLAGSLFPDVDIKSKGQYYFYHAVLLLLIALSIQQRYDLIPVVGIGAITPLIVKHRGIFHRWWFVAAVIFGAWYVVSAQFPELKEPLWYDAVFFFAGALSHLWLDMGLKKMIRI